MSNRQNHRVNGTGSTLRRYCTLLTRFNFVTPAPRISTVPISRLPDKQGLPLTHHCRNMSQESLRKWERLSCELSVTCKQAARFNCCLLKVQQNMQSQIKAIKSESNCKSASKLSTATDELQYLVHFNSSICQAMARSMEHLTDFVFVNMANLTLLRRNSYLLYLKAGIKPDTLAALRTAPCNWIPCFRTVLSSK